MSGVSSKISHGVLVVLLAGCSADTVPTQVGAIEDANTSIFAKREMVAHRGEIFFYPTAVEPTADPLVVRITYAGEGHASHFGLFTETGAYSLHSDAEGTPLFISDAVATRYSANGDEVYLANVTGVITLTGDPDHPITLEGDFNYEGGTGRFEGVSGTLHWLAVGNPDGSAQSHFEGSISTVGSSHPTP